MVLGVLGLELRAVIVVETGVIFDKGWVWLWERRQHARCQPRDGGGDFG